MPIEDALYCPVTSRLKKKKKTEPLSLRMRNFKDFVPTGDFSHFVLA